MSANHKDPEYRRNSAKVRRTTNARLKQGEQVTCHRCGRTIHEGMPFDVGHIIPAYLGGGSDLTNLAPEHRGENRSAGGRAGQAIQAKAKGANLGWSEW
ncbi:MAG: HNH endonuclease [Protaetiibacter sp.]